MRLLVCGGRDYADREYLFKRLDVFASIYGPVRLLIHGAADMKHRAKQAGIRVYAADGHSVSA